MKGHRGRALKMRCQLLKLPCLRDQTDLGFIELQGTLQGIFSFSHLFHSTVLKELNDLSMVID